MASFHTTTFAVHDDYMTPAYAWEQIRQHIPKDKKIWEPFYGDGVSGTVLESLGCDVIHEPVDFFHNDLGQLIVSNPPFSKKREVLTRLKMLDKPFILLCPASMLCTKYVYELFANELQIIIPPKRINFIKLIDGKAPTDWVDKCNFDCFYYCYKMNLRQDIIFLERLK